MIEVRDLTKSFDGKDILKGISTHFDAGKTSLIIGRSGAGKTVLLKCINSLMKPDSGEVLFDGLDITKMQKKELSELRSKMGMLFQGSALFDSMSVLENVLFPLETFSNYSKGEREDRAMDYLERVGLADAYKKYPSALSGGMMKRAGIARAIALGPRYLFCDEPNSGLDPKTALVIDELIKKITVEDNITTVVNTHDMNTVRTNGDHIIFIHEGQKEWEGTSKTLEYNDNEHLKRFVFATIY